MQEITNLDLNQACGLVYRPRNVLANMTHFHLRAERIPACVQKNRPNLHSDTRVKFAGFAGRLIRITLEQLYHCFPRLAVRIRIFLNDTKVSVLGIIPRRRPSSPL
jgi:hypothetical protein